MMDPFAIIHPRILYIEIKPGKRKENEKKTLSEVKRKDRKEKDDKKRSFH